jgi:hypothetical protein
MNHVHDRTPYQTSVAYHGESACVMDIRDKPNASLIRENFEHFSDFIRHFHYRKRVRPNRFG